MKLQFKIMLSMFAILIVFLGLGAALSLYFQRKSASGQFEQSALTLAGSLRSSLEYVMVQGNSEAIRAVVADIASAEQVSQVVILSGEQRVYASGDESQIGQIWDDEGIERALVSGETITGSTESYEGKQLGVILPVFNKPQCNDCHGSESVILGAIQIGLNRQPLDSQLRNQSLLIALVGLGSLVAVGGTLTLLMRRVVVTPLAKLDTSARSIGRGDFDVRVDVSKNDEIGKLARTFNEMAGKIAKYSKDLEESKKQLVDRGEELEEMATIRGQLIDRLVMMEEEERRRIARELHDESGQALTMIMMNLARAADDLPPEAEETRARIQEVRHLAEQTLRDLRKLIYDLRPEVLDELGLLPALRSYARSHLEEQGIAVELRFAGPKLRIPPRVEIVLFRIIQEAITNIVRHSGAKCVQINIAMETDGSAVSAMVEDDGGGFDVDLALRNRGSWGLRGIRERVASLKGTLTIVSNPGQGTRIEARIPLRAGNGSPADSDCR